MGTESPRTGGPTPAGMAAAIVAPGPATAPFRSSLTRARGRPLPFRLLALCSSLRMAGALIALVAGVIGTGTVYEHAYGHDVASLFIYQSWWFKLIFILLAVNIFGAAAVRYPWRRHQTGFVIIHSGLLCLMLGFWLAGGRLDGQLVCPPGQVVSRTELPVDYLAIVDGQSQRATTFQPLHWAGYPPVWRFLLSPFWPLPPIGVHHIAAPPEILRLDAASAAPSPVAAPAPPAQGRAGAPMAGPAVAVAATPIASRGVLLPVSAHLLAVADTARETPGYTSSDHGGPAVLVELSGHFPSMPAGVVVPVGRHWLSTAAGESTFQIGPASFSLMTTESELLVHDFFQPTVIGHDKAIPNGQLDVYWHGHPYRVAIDPARRGQTLELADDLAIRLSDYFPHPVFTGTDLHEDPKAAFDPLVVVDIATGPAATRTWQRMPVFANYPCFEAGAHVVGGPALPALLFEHPASFAPAPGQLGVTVQMLVGPDHRLYARWISRSQGFVGSVLVDDAWQGTIAGSSVMPMQLNLQATFLPSAVKGPEAERMVPDQKSRSTRWIELGVDRGSAHGQAWIARGDPRSIPLSDGSTVLVDYAQAQDDLARDHGFSVRLDHFTEGLDPGGGASASYDSAVTILHADGTPPQPAIVTMNAPLTVHGVTIYQSSFIPERDDRNQETGRYVASVFTVATDPGRYPKYLGSALLVLGILTMYAMRPKSPVPKPRSRSA